MDSGYQHTTALYSAWSEQLSAQSLQPIPADLGQRWALGRGAQLEIIAPIGEPFDGQNNNGVVMRLRYGKFCALLTGDIEAKAEERLLERRLLNSCAVLKVGHHGSKSSSIQPFLDAVRPRYALISAGEDNRFGHPHAEVLERLEAMGIPIFRTDQQGTIHLSTDGEQLWVETKRRSPPSPP
jgi:competence protein ComEC